MSTCPIFEQQEPWKDLSSTPGKAVIPEDKQTDMQGFSGR
jgi:hypothetical protein